jgi:adenine-specific DNA-methyltransferase
VDLVRRIADWALTVPVTPLSLDAVPGTSEQERRGLAALGGLAGALAGRRVKSWPAALQAWARAEAPPKAIVMAVERELSGGVDVLAATYERLVSGRNRRRLGTFFTPPAVVEFMLDRAENQIGVPAAVIDPGAGVGAFSLSARRRWPATHIVAVDVNVVTLGLLAARQEDGLELALDDFVPWASSSSVPPNGPRLWIGNPPYTRHQELSSQLKEESLRASGGLVTSRRAGLSAYFLAVTLSARQADDVICYLLPGTWVDTGYGRPLRKAVLESQAGVVEMYGFSTDIDMFPGTRVAAMALIVGPNRELGKTLVTGLARITANAVDLGRTAKRSRKSGDQRLGPYLWPRKASRLQNSQQLGDLARVRRGVATGANRHFFLTDDEKELMPPEAITRAVLKLRKLEGETLTTQDHDEMGGRGERRWLLVLRDRRLLKHASIRRWITAAKRAKVHERYLPAHRDPWYAVEVIEPPDVLVGAMSKGRIRVVLNEARVVHSNAIYGLYLDGERHLVAPLVRWLNSGDGQEALRAQSRTYGGGLLKLEPSDLSAVRVPPAKQLVDLMGGSRVDKSMESQT